MLRKSALYGALSLGILADVLVRAQGRPGIGLALWAVAGVLALAVLLQRSDSRPSTESRWLIGGAMMCAATLALRDAEVLAVFSILGAIALLVLAAGRSTKAWVTDAQLSEGAFAVVRAALLTALGPFGWGRATRVADGQSEQETAAGAGDDTAKSEPWTRRAGTLLRGSLLALPALFLLGALLMSADLVFAQLVQNAFRVDIEPLVQHAAFAGVVAWITAGYLRSLLVPDDAIMGRLRVPQPAMPSAEISVALWLLNLLFLVFTVVQLRYLFGGANLVEVTVGLSYAAYARRGFFELVLCAALVVPMLLLADWAAATETSRARSRLRLAMLVLITLLVGVIASAAYRMRLYQAAYGLTEQRLYVSVFILWLTLVLAWLAATVLRGRRRRFAFGAVMAGYACLTLLYTINPHALIARVNIARAAAGAVYDGEYLSSLSADAVPTLIARLEQLPELERCRVMRMLDKRWRGEREGGWRTWNVSDWRARKLVAERQATAGCAS